MNPDAQHFHQLIFFFIKKKYKLKTISANLLTAQIINIYNLCVFVLGSKFISNSEIQALIILFSIVLYTTIFSKLFVFKFKKDT